MPIHPLNRITARVFGKVSLRTVLIVPFVLQIVGAVGLVGYLSFRNGQQAVNDVASQLRREISDRIEQDLRTYLATPFHILQTNQDAVAQGMLSVKNLQPWELYLWRQGKLYNHTSVIGVGNEEGNYQDVERFNDGGKLAINISNKSTGYNFHTYSTNSQGKRIELIRVNKNFDPRRRPWYKAAVMAGKPTWSEIYPNVNRQTIGIAAVHPVYDLNNRLEGVLVVTQWLNEVGEYLRNLKIGRTGKAFIIERSGMMVATSSAEKPFRKNKDTTERLRASDSSDTLTQTTAKYLSTRFSDLKQIQHSQQLKFEVDGERQFLQVFPFQDGKGLDWLIVVVMPEADFMEQIHANTRTTIVLCIATLILATASCILTARWITQPILRLNIAARDIAKGEWDKTLELKRSDELGELAKSFNSMAHQLQESFAALETNNAEMQALNQALSENESRLAQFLDAMPVGVFVTEANGKPYYTNQIGKQILGQGIVESAIAEQLPEVYQAYLAGTEQLYPSDREPIINALQGKSVKVDDMEIRRPSKTIPIETWGTPIYDESGNIAYAIVVFQDITQRKQAEQLIAEYNRTLELQVQQRTQELQTALDYLRATQEELIHSEKMVALGQLVAGVAHEINTPLGVIRSSIENITDFLTNNLEKLPSFFQKLSPECQHFFLVLLSKSNQKAALLSSREKRQIKKHLKRQLEEQTIDNADSLASTLLAIGVQDDIQPLLPLLKNPDSEAILKTAYELASVQISTRTITTATERAAKVVFALKSYAHYNHSGEKVQADITEGIETVLTLYHNQLKRAVELIRNYEEVPVIWCYPDELNQVWTNLVHNALQAMDYTGTLRIDVTRQEQNVLISITDSGKGIPSEIMPKIFEPFFTTKPAGEGSGLGLNIVKKIVEKHQGTIDCDSVAGKTTFTVSIPFNS